jgi:hypothetical protein
MLLGAGRMPAQPVAHGYCFSRVYTLTEGLAGR